MPKVARLVCGQSGQVFHPRLLGRLLLPSRPGRNMRESPERTLAVVGSSAFPVHVPRPSPLPRASAGPGSHRCHLHAAHLYERERERSWLTRLGLLQQSKCSLICCSVVHIGVKSDLLLKVKEQEEKYLMYIIATLECCPWLFSDY